MKKIKPQKGMALLLVMAVIVVVLTTISIAVTLLINNIDAGRGKDDSIQAVAAAQAGIEQVRLLYKNNNNLFNNCQVNDCIDFTHSNNCTSCGDSAAMHSDGNRRYKVAIVAKNPSGGNTTGGVTLLATGYKGLFNRSITTGLSFYKPFVCGSTVTATDGIQYSTVKIDNQCWMAESLRTKYKPDGSCINNDARCADASASDEDQGRSCYDNIEANCDKNGALYTWNAAMNGDFSGGRGICPYDWHIPTDEEWRTLETFFTESGQTCDPNRNNNFDCSDAGSELATSGALHFNGKYAGSRKTNGKDFENEGDSGIFWSSISSGNTAYVREIANKNNEVNRRNNNKGNSYSVRCLKD